MGGHQLREDWKNSSSSRIFLESQGNSRLPTIRGQSRASFKLSSFSKEAAHLLKGSEDVVRTETLPASRARMGMMQQIRWEEGISPAEFRQNTPFLMPFGINRAVHP